MSRVNNSVPDQGQRRRALDPAESFIVQAPAGSGKTELLIQRFLALLAREEYPESVVAITFTIKAAGEMRERVLKALRLADGEAPAQEHERQTWELARAVLQQDRQRGWGLLENPARLRVQTIDAFCSSLVRRMPWLSRFGALPRIEEKAENLYRLAARETLALLESSDPVAESLDLLLRHLDNDFSTLENLLVEMLAKRDQWLRHVAGNPAPRKLRLEIEAALKNVIRESLEKTRSALPPRVIPGILEWSEVDELPSMEPESLPAWLKITDSLLTQKGDLRKNAENSSLLSVESGDPFLSYLKNLRKLPPERFSDKQWEAVGALLEVLRVAAAQLFLVFRREGAVDFPEVAQAARKALGPPDQPTELAFSLDYKIQHILVDEFQDTSWSQYELLRALTAQWQPDDGRTIFLVGDPMQSIYRFRDAEVGLFLRVRREGLGHLRLVPLTLKVNFRSDGSIVQWVNQAFPSAFSAEEEETTGAVCYAPSIAFHPARNSPCVALHPFLDDGKEKEAEQVVDLIRQARREDPRGTVAVLVRSRKHLDTLLPKLHKLGWRYRAVEIDELVERPVVQDLLALTRALLHLGDRTAWLAVLRAPWCGLSLEDLFHLAGGDHASTVRDLLNDADRIAALSPDGQERIRRVHPALEQALQERGRLPLRRWVEGTWTALGGPACVSGETAFEDAAAYLDLLESQAAAADIEDLDAFEEAVAALYGRPDVEADDTLQLMTIHKAKGLEFDTVIVPGLGRTTQGEAQRLLFWQERINQQRQAELLLAPIKESGSEKDPVYDYLKWIDDQKTKHENTRLLYVAATRAKKRLHLLGHARADLETGELRAPGSGSLLRKIWETAEPVFRADLESLLQRDAEPEQIGLSFDEESPRFPLRRLPAGWRLPEPPADVVWRPPAPETSAEEEEPAEKPISFEWVGVVQRRVGTVVHALLHRLATEPELKFRPELARAALAAQGVSPDDLDEAVRRVGAAIEGVLSDGRGKWLLARHQDAHAEFPLAGLLHGRFRHFVIDRTFIDENGVRWIIDYKTSSHEGGDVERFLDNERIRYQQQLEQYAALMARREERLIRLGLYFPLLQGWREWAYEAVESAAAGSSR